MGNSQHSIKTYMFKYLPSGIYKSETRPFKYIKFTEDIIPHSYYDSTGIDYLNFPINVRYQKENTPKDHYIDKEVCNHSFNYSIHENYQSMSIYYYVKLLDDIDLCDYGQVPKGDYYIAIVHKPTQDSIFLNKDFKPLYLINNQLNNAQTSKLSINPIHINQTFKLCIAYLQHYKLNSFDEFITDRHHIWSGPRH